jgi:hypothetical protein
MRTGNEDTGDDYLLPDEQSADMPLPPVPAHPAPEPVMSMMPMPASVMSPDEMLRAYAERKMKSPPPTGSLAFPVPAASYSGNGMRTLYTPSSQEDTYTERGSYIGTAN